MNLFLQNMFRKYMKSIELPKQIYHLTNILVYSGNTNPNFQNNRSVTHLSCYVHIWESVCLISVNLTKIDQDFHRLQWVFARINFQTLMTVLAPFSSENTTKYSLQIKNTSNSRNLQFHVIFGQTIVSTLYRPR